MIKSKKKVLPKIVGIILMMVLGSSFVGCNITSDNDYKKAALETLEERYGEEFDIKQLGGTFGALNKTKKLVCYPVSSPDKFFYVEVEKDLSEVHDNYINRIMEEKLNEMLTPIAKEIFGEKVKIQSMFDHQYNEYDSLDMNVVDFMNINYRCTYVLNIFIDGGENIDKSQEAEKISIFGQKLLENNLFSTNSVNIWYTKDDEYNNVESKYYDIAFEGSIVEYYLNEDKIYNTAWFKIVDKKMHHTTEDIINSFKY